MSETRKDPKTLKPGDKMTGRFAGRLETWEYLGLSKSGRMFKVRRGGEEIIANPMTFGYAVPETEES